MPVKNEKHSAYYLASLFKLVFEHIANQFK